MKLRLSRAPADYHDEATLLRDCRRQVRSAQRHLYERFAPQMLAVSQRYLRDDFEAEDALLRAFAKVFAHLDRFEGTGSLEGWVRRIVVNEALMTLRRGKLMYAHVETVQAEAAPGLQPADSSLEADDLLAMVQRLPTGYRTVFNLYAVEGYHHQEIAQQLGISVGTSKSQLSRARLLLQSYLRQNETIAKKNVSHADPR